MIRRLSIYYSQCILGYPRAVLIILSIIFVFFVSYVNNFKLDASADSLLLEDDVDLKKFRDLIERYETKDFLFVTFTPNSDLFSKDSLDTIRSLREDINQLELTDSIITLLDVPLVKQIEGTLSDMANNYRTLESEDVNIKRARQELLESPIYRNLIISPDGKTTALQVNLKDNIEYRNLLKERSRLLGKSHDGTISDAEQIKLNSVLLDYDEIKIKVDDLIKQETI